MGSHAMWGNAMRLKVPPARAAWQRSWPWLWRRQNKAAKKDSPVTCNVSKCNLVKRPTYEACVAHTINHTIQPPSNFGLDEINCILFWDYKRQYKKREILEFSVKKLSSFRLLLLLLLLLGIRSFLSLQAWDNAMMTMMTEMTMRKSFWHLKWFWIKKKNF